MLFYHIISVLCSDQGQKGLMVCFSCTAGLKETQIVAITHYNTFIFKQRLKKTCHTLCLEVVILKVAVDTSVLYLIKITRKWSVLVF